MNTLTQQNALAASRLTGGQVATRVASLDFSFMGLLLPNPDPILRATGKAISVYREISRDTHVGACIRRRKSAVKALQWGVDRAQAPARVAKAVSDMLDGLNMEALIGNALEAPLYGYAPMEIMWQNGTGGTWASDVVALPPEWFSFDSDAQLRFRTRTSPVIGELLPARKFLLPRQDATYQNPYGLADLALCYWPTIFGKGGKKFWLAFAEKYGSAFAVGKLPRGAEAAERTALLDSLEALLQNAVATIPDDGSVELVEMAGKSASADLYERLVLHCRGEVSIVLTGTNQTVEATANKASAHAGMDVAGDLRDADAGIVADTVNQLIRWTCELNYPGAQPPVFSMWDQTAKDELQAKRDKNNYDSGARFTKSYWMRAYGYQADDLADTAAPAAAPGAPAALGAVAFAAHAAAATAADPTAAQQEALAAAAAPTWAAMVDQVAALIDQASDLGALQRTLAEAYSSLPTEQLTRLMTAAFALAQLKGMVDVQAGN